MVATEVTVVMAAATEAMGDTEDTMAAGAMVTKVAMEADMAIKADTADHQAVDTVVVMAVVLAAATEVAMEEDPVEAAEEAAAAVAVGAEAEAVVAAGAHFSLIERTLFDTKITDYNTPA